MASRNNVNIFSSGSLQCKAYLNKFLLRYGSSHSFLRNLKVLAKSTAEITTGQKDCSRTSRSGYRRFFSKVEPCPRNAQLCRFSAETSLTSVSIYSAAFRAGGTAFIFCAAKIPYRHFRLRRMHGILKNQTEFLAIPSTPFDASPRYYKRKPHKWQAK